MAIASVAVEPGGTFALARQGGRRVAAFGPTSAGAVGTWGPLSAIWSVGFLISTSAPVNTLGPFTGVGPMAILPEARAGWGPYGAPPNSPAAGVAVPLPGSESPPGVVPSAALDMLDGVAAGWTWDAAFVHHFRFLCVCNEGIAGGRRRTYIDGVQCGDVPASTNSIAADTPLALFAGCSLTFAEYYIWNGVTLSQEAVRAQTLALRFKWNIYVLPSVPDPVRGLGTVFVSAQATRASPWLPSKVPKPACWLDGSDASTVFNDSQGNTSAVSGQNVCVWKDRSGNGRHATFSEGAASWSANPADWVNGQRVVDIAGRGFFAHSPLADIDVNVGYTIVAVWRVTNAGGHPFSVRELASFKAASGWQETIDSVSHRVMPVDRPGAFRWTAVSCGRRPRSG